MDTIKKIQINCRMRAYKTPAQILKKQSAESTETYHQKPGGT